MSGGIQQQRQMVEQLRREASYKRIPLSQTVEDIKVQLFSFETVNSLLSVSMSNWQIRMPCFSRSRKKLCWLKCWFCQRFVLEHNSEDFLLHGFQGKNANPYRFITLHVPKIYFWVFLIIASFGVFRGSLIIFISTISERSRPAWCFELFCQTNHTMKC